MDVLLYGILIIFFVIVLLAAIVVVFFGFILGSIYYFKFYRQKIKLLEVLTEKKKQEIMKDKKMDSKNKGEKDDLLEKIDDLATQQILLHEDPFKKD